MKQLVSAYHWQSDVKEAAEKTKQLLYLYID